MNEYVFSKYIYKGTSCRWLACASKSISYIHATHNNQHISQAERGNGTPHVHIYLVYTHPSSFLLCIVVVLLLRLSS